MLEMLPRVSVTQDVHRLANLTHLAAFAGKKGLTIDEVTDVIVFNRDEGFNGGTVPAKAVLWE